MNFSGKAKGLVFTRMKLKGFLKKIRHTDVSAAAKDLRASKKS